MSQFEQVDFDHVKIILSKKELRYIRNDLIAYILEIKHRVLGKESVDYPLSNDNNPTEKQRKDLEARGFYDRIDLLEQLYKVDLECFPDITTNGG